MTNEEIADAIVADLFRNGFENEADRLVLTTREGRNLGGWSRRPARDRVLEILRAARVEAGR